MVSGLHKDSFINRFIDSETIKRYIREKTQEDVGGRGSIFLSITKHHPLSLGFGYFFVKLALLSRNQHTIIKCIVPFLFIVIST